MPIIDESSVVISNPLPLEAPSEASLVAEASMLGDAFTEVSAHPADLIADAEEMLRARGDVADLQKRGFEVSDGQFERVRLLVEMLKPLSALQTRQAEASKLKTADAEATRLRLLEIRSDLAALGKAARLPLGLFSLETQRTQRLNIVIMKMEDVLANVKTALASMPDKQRVGTLVAEARQLIDQHKEARQMAKLIRSDRTIENRKAARYERMLFSALQYLSTQGLAAYPRDLTREAMYRLDHVYGRRASKVKDPGAGGAEGVPDAN
jgi:hypothetical protein